MPSVKRAVIDAEATAKLAYRKATANGPWAAMNISNRDDPLHGCVAAKRDEHAIAGLLSSAAAAAADAKKK